MAKKTDIEKIKRIEDDLLRYNNGSGIIIITDLAKYYKMKPERISEMLKDCSYYDGRSHRYYIFDVAEAMYSHLTNNTIKKQYLDTPLRKAV